MTRKRYNLAWWTVNDSNDAEVFISREQVEQLIKELSEEKQDAKITNFILYLQERRN